MLAVLLDRRRARFFEINDQLVTELPVHAEPTAVRDAALAAAARHAGETEQALLEAALMRRPREVV